MTSIKRKGLSTIVATVLITILTVAAVAVIAQYIIPFIKGNTEKTDCLPYTDYFTFQEELSLNGNSYHYNCFNSTSGLIGVSVKAAAMDYRIAQKIIGFDLVLSNDDGSTKASIRGGDPAFCNAGTVRMLGSSASCPNPREISIPNSGETLSYVYNSGTAKYNKAKIYPIINTNRTCQSAEEITLIPCEVNLG